MEKRTGFKCTYCGRNFSKDYFKSDGTVGECFSCAAIYRNDGGNIVEVSHVIETRDFPYYKVVLPNGVALQGIQPV